MLAFEVSVNEQHLCTASMATHKVLSMIVSCTSRDLRSINFHVGGIEKSDGNQHTDWDTPELQIGDEVRGRYRGLRPTGPLLHARELPLARAGAVEWKRWLVASARLDD